MSLITDAFPKLRTQKNVLRWMPKKFRFKWSFGKEHGKRAQTLLKFTWQNLYHIYWLLGRQFTFKKSLSVICKIWRVFPSTLSTDGNYSLLNRDNLTQPIQMQVSRKERTISEFFFAFLKSNLNFEHFQKKKDEPHSWCISEITDPEKDGKINVEKVPFQGILRKATW